MVQFNPNLNVGKTAKLNSSAQVGKTDGPDKKEPPKVKPAAVWIGFEQTSDNYKENDVILYLSNDGTFLAKRLERINGRLQEVTIDVSDISVNDFETDRGNIHDPSSIF